MTCIEHRFDSDGVSSRDALAAVTLHGTAIRAAVDQWPVDQAVDELRRLADGRNDLLAREAGLTAGAWLASPATHVGHELIAAGLLIFAGHRLDYSELERWVHIGYERGRTARGDIHAGPRPPTPR